MKEIIRSQGESLSVSELASKTYSLLMKAFGVTVIGAYIGLQMVQFLMKAYVTVPLVIVWFVLIFKMGAVREKGTVQENLKWFYLFAFIGGLFLAPTIFFYAKLGSPWLIWKSLILTAAIFIGLSIYSRNATAKGKDFSNWYGTLFASLIGLLVLMIISIFTTSTAFEILISILGIILFSFLIVFDTQRLITNKHQEDAPLIALGLYLDFLNLFLFVLRIFGINTGKK